MLKNFFLASLLALLLASGLFAINSFSPSGQGIFHGAQRLNMGLDLVGGSALVLKADLDEYFIAQNLATLENIKKILKNLKITNKGAQLTFQELKSTEKTIEMTLPPEVIKILKTEDLLRNFEDSYNFSWGPEKLTLTVKANHALELSKSVIEESKKNIRKRIDFLGAKDIAITSVGKDRILVEAPGTHDPTQIKNLIGKTAKMTFHLVDDFNQMTSSESEFMAGEGRDVLKVSKKIELDGSHLKSAKVNLNSSKNQYAVTFTLDSSGASIFGNLTASNVGRRVAIAIDKKIVTAPQINEAIFGAVEITGNFTQESASMLASVLRAGALPVKFQIVEEKIVGAVLGQELINNGKKSLIIAFTAVSGFMILIYGALGCIAALAIIANASLVITIMTLSGSVLSLAGVAGLVLTIGMVVDSNVLIFERIREELAKEKKSYITAIHAGFESGLATIVDSNITTLIASVLLLILGDSNIKGFAITLTYGVIVSFFTSVTLTRLLVGLSKRQILRFSFPKYSLNTKNSKLKGLPNSQNFVS